MDEVKATKLKEEGNVHFKNGNLDQAMTCYFEAVKFNPNDMNIYGNMAQVMIRKSEYNEAKQLLQMALQIEPTYVKGHYRLGLVYSHLAQNDLALKCFNEALRLDPTNKAAQAQIRSLSDRPDDAFKRNLCIVSDDRIGAKRVQETLKEVQNEMGRVSLDSKFTHKNKDDDTKASSETKTVTPIKLTRFELPNKVPQTQFQFTCVWNEVPDPDTRLIFLQRIGADHFGRLFAKGLEPNLFSELLQMLMTARDVEFVTQMLITLSQTRRFDTLLLFLESKDKSSMFEEMRNLKKLLSNVKTNGTMEKQSLEKLLHVYRSS